MVELVDFYADWCGPCKVMDPILEDLERELSGKITITKVNVDEKPQIASQHGVLSIPTYIVKKDGVEVSRTVGAVPKDKLKEKITSNL